MKQDALILVRGGGDLATGTIHRLWSAGLRVLVLEAEHPAAIRRQVSLCEAVYEVDKDIIFMGLAGSQMIKAAEEVGLQAASEVFADRAYNDDGTLVSRKLPGAVIKDKDLAIKRVVRMVKEGKVESINGNDISIKADSICVHGDNPKALEFVKNIRETLVAEGVEIKNLFR